RPVQHFASRHARLHLVIALVRGGGEFHRERAVAVGGDGAFHRLAVDERLAGSAGGEVGGGELEWLARVRRREADEAARDQANVGASARRGRRGALVLLVGRGR